MTMGEAPKRGKMGTIHHIVSELIYGPKVFLKKYIDYLRSIGMSIEDNCILYSPRRCVIDETRPRLVEMGDNVLVTEGVTILTYGYDQGVFKGKYGDVLGLAGHVIIGSNVFIGMNLTILKGTTIGDNDEIGANSLINKDTPSDCVVACNPQRIVCSIDDYLEKRRSAQLSEAIDLYRYWRINSPKGKRGDRPTKDLFREFIWLFEGHSANGILVPEFERVMALCGTFEKSVERYKETERMLDGFDDFIKHLDTSLISR